MTAFVPATADAPGAMGAGMTGGAARSVLVGLLGAGIGPSRTPAMHEAAARALGLPLVYRPVDTGAMMPAPGVEDLLTWAERFGFTGLNVTYPFKRAVLPHLHELSDAARAVGAVNTVVFRDGRRIGHNTDHWGFARAFEAACAGRSRHRVLLLGAGGAGGAVAHALLAAGTGRLTIADPDTGRATALADALCAAYGPGRATVAAAETAATTSDGVVNATPVGMEKHPGVPIDPGVVPAGCWVIDIIYFPAETAFLRAVRERGCDGVNGEAMALFQAVRAFELFTGRAPDQEVMRAALRPG